MSRLGCIAGDGQSASASIQRKADSALLYDEYSVIGALVRTREKVRPVFVTPGHKKSQSGNRWTGF
ncbi:MAG: endonuclease V [Candidatus Zhuqueibacterota bacterium]